jgi:hypothetical protein
MRTKFFIVAAMVTALTTTAFAPVASAQAPQRINIRGTVAKLDGQALTVKTADKGNVSVTLAPNYMVRALVKKKLSDIHPGDFVGTTSVPGDDGKLHAVEVHFFPANLNLPETQSPWDSTARATMTNAHVQGVAKAAQGSLLSINYKGSVAEVIVDKKTQIVAPSPKAATPADLKPGRAVYIIATKADNGALTTTNVTVEKNGVKPPM